MPSAEADRRDRRYRERTLDQALAEARAGTDRLRRLADVEAPDREDDHLDAPNRGGRS